MRQRVKDAEARAASAEECSAKFSRSVRVHAGMDHLCRHVDTEPPPKLQNWQEVSQTSLRGLGLSPKEVPALDSVPPEGAVESRHR